MYLLEDDRGVTIAVMREYIANRFKTHEMIAPALGSAPKPKLPPPHSRRGKGRGGWFKGKGRGRERNGPSPFSAGKGKDGVVGRPPACEYCVVKKRPLNSHRLSRCPWVSAATHSDLIQVLPKLCVGCLRIKPDGIHKCPPQFKEGGVSSHLFCLQCKCNVKLCKSPTTHKGMDI